MALLADGEGGDVAAEGLRHRVAEEAADQAGEAEQHRRRGEGRGHVVVGRRRRLRARGVHEVGATLAHERAPPEAQRVGHRQRGAGDERGGEDHPRQRQDAGAVPADQVGQALEAGLLGDEAERRRHGGHRRAGQQRGAGDDGHAAPHAVQPTQVARAGAVVDDADDEEQRRLEERVPDQERQPAERGGPGADAAEHHEEAELADGPVREQDLDVVLPQRAPAADDHRRGTEGQQDRPPARRAREDRGQDGDEVDAGLDHGRRVQVGADRGGRGHRPGQPEVEGHQRRLGQGTDQQQEDRGDDGRRPHAGGRGRGQHPGQREGPVAHAEQDDAGQHRQAAEGRHHQGRERGATVGGEARVVPDEQVGEDRGRAPRRRRARPGRPR